LTLGRFCACTGSNFYSIGPLFLLYLFIIFADDTKSHNEIKSVIDKDKLQECINSLVKWSIKWLLGFNGQKCKMMHLGRNNPCYEYTIPDGDNIIKLETTECEKDLGVHVDPLLEFNEHIAKIVKKSRSLAGIILRNISSRTNNIIVPLFVFFYI